EVEVRLPHRAVKIEQGGFFGEHREHPSLFIPCGTAKFSDLSLTHINVQIVFLRWDLSKRVREGSMQICNATYDRQLDLLDSRASMLGFDLYAIESCDVFE